MSFVWSKVCLPHLHILFSFCLSVRFILLSALNLPKTYFSPFFHPSVFLFISCFFSRLPHTVFFLAKRVYLHFFLCRRFSSLYTTVYLSIFLLSVFYSLAFLFLSAFLCGWSTTVFVKVLPTLCFRILLPSVFLFICISFFFLRFLWFVYHCFSILLLVPTFSLNLCFCISFCGCVFV
jgi:hypothetical protein